MNFLRGRPRPDGAEPPNRGASLRARRDTETALLEAWAAERGLILPWSVWKPRFRPGGAEHDVFQDAASQRWFKVTKGGGLVIDNFLWYEGTVFPIDALICVADPEMAAFLSLTPTARRRETPFRSRLATKSSSVEKP